MYQLTIATDAREDVALSADDVKALRLADMVAFDHNESKPENTRIRAIVTGHSDGVFDRNADATRYIPVQSHITSYNEGETYQSAYALIQSAKFNEEWLTARNAIRAGDTLVVEWRANANGYTKDAGLNLDELVLHIRRNGKRVGSFLLIVSVCPNNSARMLQYTTYRFA